MSYVGMLPYSDTMTSTEVTECRETFCEVWSEDASGLTCYDVDEVYPPGHYHFEIGPDYTLNLGYPTADGPWVEVSGDLQVFTEY